MTKWQIHYHPEVVSYLIARRESCREVRQAIGALAANPRPQQAIALPDWPDIYELFAAEHRIRYVVSDDAQTVGVLLVKPGRKESA